MKGKTWVVDSNAFIHFGNLAKEEFKVDLSKCLQKNGGSLNVTSGVHGEVRNVRFKIWDGRPNLLETLQDILVTSEVSDAEIRNVASTIGEKAAPQDVDLSLMILAARYHQDGKEVTLVTDDFKMTTTKEKAGFGFETCPPSTFLFRISEEVKGNHSSRMRTLSRRVRSAEMRYAISRAAEYDVQSKLTWLVDSLLTSRPRLPSPPNEAEEKDEKEVMVRTLQRILRGEKVKSSRRKKLGKLPEICHPASEIDQSLEMIMEMEEVTDLPRIYGDLVEVSRSCQESVGLGLASVDDSIAGIAHRATAGPLSRLETVLGMLSGLLGRPEVSRLHLSRSLYLSSLSLDDVAELKTLHQLGLLSLSTESNERAAELFDKANQLATERGHPNLTHLTAAALSRFLSGDGEVAASQLEQARQLIKDDKEGAIQQLLKLAHSLLGVDRPWFALEIFDEALECAVEVGSPKADEIKEMLLLANTAATGVEDGQLAKIREFLDNLNKVSSDKKKDVKSSQDAIRESMEDQENSEIEYWDDWREADKLLVDDSTLRIVRSEVDDEGRVLLVVHHSIFGGLGIFIPNDAPEVSANQNVKFSGTRIKVAKPPESLEENQNIKGIIALENPEALEVRLEETEFE
jgi:tetratricopeptide (TPR) repeat protein/rRNA maturation endonuclease Nob1